MRRGEPEHYSWHLGSPDNAVGTEVIVNPYADISDYGDQPDPHEARRAALAGRGNISERLLQRDPKIAKKAFRTSMSINHGGKEVLLPTIDVEGNALSEEEAVANYMLTGQHLGHFDSPDEATEFAKSMYEGK